MAQSSKAYRRRRNLLREAGIRLFSKPGLSKIYHGMFGRKPDPADLQQSAAMVEELYHGIFNRPPDAAGKEFWSRELASGHRLRQVVKRLLASEEFQASRGRFSKTSELADIRSLLPRPYRTEVGLDTFVHHVFPVENDGEFDLLERLIVELRFYDSVGEWGYAIDLDKRVTAALVSGLGARSCLDIGCSNGPVISVLAAMGLDVAGIDASHLAFALAFPNIRGKMLYGDLLSLSFDRTFDAILAMDILEHMNPFKLGAYIERVAELISRNGYFLVNSPMYGEDRVFGTPFPFYLEEWKHESQETFWRNIPCYENGWPMHGHLIWACVEWWERQFTAKGLVRDIEIETAVQDALSGFFADYAPARKALFVLRRADYARNSSEVARSVADTLARVEGLPRPR